MRKLSEKWRRLWRKVWQVLGVTAIGLIFQAAYGMMQSTRISGSVKSNATNEPVPNIKVTLSPENPGSGDSSEMEVLTDENGTFWFSLPSTYSSETYILEFEETGEDGKFRFKRVIVRWADRKPVDIKLDER